MKSINPATGELVKEYGQMDDSEINGIIQKATAAQRGWAELSYEQRAKRLYNAAKLLEINSEEYAELMAREMGKPLAQGRCRGRKMCMGM
ncbi:MAG: aldehyde dehydrogenase family protein [Balneolaceae bacterium]|nr:aldehyde dehydrogenase family protein [Balneolaceae bacterium]